MSMSDSPLEVKQTLTLRGVDLPEIQDWDVDNTYNLRMRVKMTGVSKDEYGEKGLVGRFEVEDVVVDDGEPIKPREKSPEEDKAEKISQRIKKGRTY